MTSKKKIDETMEVIKKLGTHLHKQPECVIEFVLGWFAPDDLEELTQHLSDFVDAIDKEKDYS